MFPTAEVSKTIQELNAKRSVYLTREGDRGKQQQHVNDLTCGDEYDLFSRHRLLT